MTAHELADLVKRMRAAQNAYFRNGRTTEQLSLSKILEREVDAAVEAVLNPKRPALGLFDPAPGELTEERLREVIGPTPLLDDEDYRLLVGSANADAHEGADWLPYYKAANGLLMQAFAMVEVVAAIPITPGSQADGRRAALIRKARGLVLLSQRVCGIGPQDVTPELVSKVDAINAELFG